MNNLIEAIKKFFDTTPRCHCGEPIHRFPDYLECRYHAELRINKMIWEWRTSAAGAAHYLSKRDKA